MAPGRKGKGKETTGSETENSQRSVRGRNAYIAQPADPYTRPMLRMTGYRTFDAGYPEHTEKVNKVISQILRIHYPGPFSRYTDFPEKTQSVIKAEFLKHYQFAEEVDENGAWDTFRKIAGKQLQDMLNKAKIAARKSYGDSILSWKEHSAPHPHEWITPDIWPGVMDYWCSDAFANRSQRNKINRAAAGESSGATMGSVNMLVHKQRFEKKHGREPRWSDELFKPTHTSKKTGQFISAKAEKAQENYEKAMVQKYGEDRNIWPPYDDAVWYFAAVDDQNAHGDNYGLGALGKTRTMVRDGGSSSAPSRSSQSYSSVPPRLRQEDIDAISS